MAYDDQVVTLSKSGTGEVYIWCEKIDESIFNDSRSDTKYYITPSKQAAGVPPETKTTDGHRFKHVFVIVGQIRTQTIGGVSKTAKQAKDYLVKSVFFEYGDMLLKYRDKSDRDYSDKYRDNTDTDTTYIHTILDKVEFTDGVNRADETDGGIKAYNVTISLMRGLVR